VERIGFVDAGTDIDEVIEIRFTNLKKDIAAYQELVAVLIDGHHIVV